MRLRPNRLLPSLFVFASMGAACQLVNGIGDELTYEPGDGGDAAADVTHDQTVPQADSGDDRATFDADATPSNDADAAPSNDADAAIADDAPHDADATIDDADADAAAPHCPLNPRAPDPMTLITTPSGSSYCIDNTEVTRASFVAYMQSGRTLGSSVPAECFADGAGLNTPVQPTADLAYPVSNVPFCYAWDYCDWAGKRLCGKVGGGTLTSTATSEWYFACSNGPAPTKYPYGDTFDGAACVTDASGPSATGTHPACHGTAPPFSTILDMSGNLAEWDQTDWRGAQVAATYRGGSFNAGDDHSCTGSPQIGIGSNSFDFIGFRCCADVQ